MGGGSLTDELKGEGDKLEDRSGSTGRGGREFLTARVEGNLRTSEDVLGDVVGRSVDILGIDILRYCPVVMWVEILRGGEDDRERWKSSSSSSMASSLIL